MTKGFIVSTVKKTAQYEALLIYVGFNESKMFKATDIVIWEL